MKKLMTNHPKDAHISDSASRITEETMASEIREGNRNMKSTTEMRKEFQEGSRWAYGETIKSLLDHIEALEKRVSELEDPLGH